jgi:hypothetical protein
VDIAVVSEVVAGLLAAGGVKELGEAAGGGLVAGITGRVRKVFGSDARSVDALERVQRDEPGAVGELTSALAWYARRDQAFAEELAAWAAQAGGRAAAFGQDSVAVAGDIDIHAETGGLAAWRTGDVQMGHSPDGPAGPSDAAVDPQQPGRSSR